MIVSSLTSAVRIESSGGPGLSARRLPRRPPSGKRLRLQVQIGRHRLRRSSSLNEIGEGNLLSFPSSSERPRTMGGPPRDRSVHFSPAGSLRVQRGDNRGQNLYTSSQDRTTRRVSVFRGRNSEGKFHEANPIAVAQIGADTLRHIGLRASIRCGLWDRCSFGMVS